MQDYGPLKTSEVFVWGCLMSASDIMTLICIFFMQMYFYLYVHMHSLWPVRPVKWTKGNVTQTKLLQVTHFIRMYLKASSLKQYMSLLSNGTITLIWLCPKFFGGPPCSKNQHGGCAIGLYTLVKWNVIMYANCHAWVVLFSK